MPKKEQKNMPNENQWKKIREEKQERIDKAINSREKSIAYFNSVNAAIELVKTRYGMKISDNKTEELEKFIITWRDWFYSQWQEWYLSTLPQPHWTDGVPKTAIKSELEEEEKGEVQYKEANEELSTLEE